jgi:sulfate transport system permease protein
LIIQKLEEFEVPAATVIGTVMPLFSLVSLLVINALQIWGQRYLGSNQSG